MNTKKHSTFLFLFLSGLFFSFSSIATDLLPPQQVINTISEQMKQALSHGEKKQSFVDFTKQVEMIIHPNVDFTRMSALVLGKHWKTATKQERGQFIYEFRALLTRTYSRTFLELSDWQLTFLVSKIKADAEKVIIKTKVKADKKPEIEIHYRMISKKGQWKVYDFMIEGISLIKNYRKTFSDEIKSAKSLTKVIEKMAKRNKAALNKSLEAKT